VTRHAAADQAAFSSALADPAQPCPEGFVTWNGSDPARRFGVHRNNVVASLVDALGDTYPVLRTLVGDAFFDAMAAVFVRRHPPRSRVLAEYGAELPAFVEAFDPARPVPYLADVARLEWARVRAFHAADGAAVGRDAVERALARAGARAGELRLTLHGSVSVVASSHAVLSIWSAHQCGAGLEGVDPDVAEQVLVLRDGLEVRVLLLGAADAACISALARGEAIGQAAAAGLAASPAFDLAAALAPLFSHGAVLAVAPPQELAP
jgi:hypothetical protein